jgi:hypothetical protein
VYVLGWPLGLVCDPDRAGPQAPSTTGVPAELRLNWVNVARVAVDDAE